MWIVLQEQSTDRTYTGSWAGAAGRQMPGRGGWELAACRGTTGLGGRVSLGAVHRAEGAQRTGSLDQTEGSSLIWAPRDE